MTPNAPGILTPRLALEPLTVEDASDLYAYRSLPEVMRYQVFRPRALADAEALLARTCTAGFDRSGTWCQLGLRLRDSGRLIGDMGLHFRADSPQQTEFGITVAPSHQGQGYAGEALLALFGHLFGTLGKHRVHASVDPRNDACIALLESVGMRREGHLRESLLVDGEWVDDLLYAVLRSEWEARS